MQGREWLGRRGKGRQKPAPGRLLETLRRSLAFPSAGGRGRGGRERVSDRSEMGSVRPFRYIILFGSLSNGLGSIPVMQERAESGFTWAIGLRGGNGLRNIWKVKLAKFVENLHGVRERGGVQDAARQVIVGVTVCISPGPTRNTKTTLHSP